MPNKKGIPRIANVSIECDFSEHYPRIFAKAIVETPITYSDQLSSSTGVIQKTIETSGVIVDMDYKDRDIPLLAIEQMARLNVMLNNIHQFDPMQLNKLTAFQKVFFPIEKGDKK